MAGFERWLLRRNGEAEWREVTFEEWIRAERAAGFRPNLPSDDPRYMKVQATGGFSGGGVHGKVEIVRYFSPRTADAAGNTPLPWLVLGVLDYDKAVGDLVIRVEAPEELRAEHPTLPKDVLAFCPDAAPGVPRRLTPQEVLAFIGTECQDA